MHRIPSLGVLLCALVLALPGSAHAADEEDTRMNAGTFTGLELRGIGPALMSGRISDIVVHPDDTGTWYVAVGSGGVWKTTNAGTTWTPIFDDQSSYSIGCITLDPNDPDTVWVGTGENVSGRHVGYGDGVYRSRDGGRTWEHMGLEESEHVGMIRIRPGAPNVVYVAAQGPLWSGGGQRGLYMSEDGGETWNKVLGGGEWTGVNEVHLDPTDPDVMYASTHQRLRTVAALMNGGPESGIHKSVDGGRTWRELTTGLPQEDMGKIGLTVSPHDPDIVYATIELGDREGGFWRSLDGGESWEKRNDYLSGGTGPHYYQEIFADPHHRHTVYQMDVRLHRTTDGGETFEGVNEQYKHVDNHALAFAPHDPDYLLAGCDGGVYESWDRGQSWKFVSNLPVTQFYKLDVDYDEPFYHVVGGTQDNNTQYGPTTTDNVHGIRNSDWRITMFGDGHEPAIDYSDPDIIYSQWQQGNHMRVDRVTGEYLYIQPQPAEGEPHDRWNWDSPILISQHDPARIYVASQRLWRSDDRGDSWRALSGDLTRDEDRLTLEMMDRVWSIDAPWDLYAMSMFNTITSIAESPLDENLMYVGTDDGLIQVTEDGGETWRRIDDFGDVPERAYVNDIRADLHDVDTVYALFDAHKMGDFAPYVLRSTDRGRSWESMNGDLPDRHVVWRMVQDHEDPELFFLGTEFGVFFTLDAGERWIELSGSPTIAFRDLVIQRRENDLVGATFGRGFFVLDDYEPLREIDEELLESPAHLFEVEDADWYVQRRVLGGSQKASQGDAFYVAPNPPFGAVFTYYLRDALKTREQERQEQEKEIAAEGGDTPYPGWDALREEELEDEPAILLTVRDANGNVVRHVEGPTSAGIHRVAWDLRYPTHRAETDGEVDEGDGFLAAPGSYSVELVQRHRGEVTVLAGRERFDLVPLRERGLPGAPLGDVAAFHRELEDVQGRVSAVGSLLDDTAERIDAIKAALARAPVPADGPNATARALERQVEEMKERLRGHRRRARYNEEGPISIQQRIGVARTGVSRSTYGPTPMHRETLRIGVERLENLSEELQTIVRTDLPALERELDAAGVPWTPGRGVPDGR